MWKNINQVIQCELLKIPYDFHILLEECERYPGSNLWKCNQAHSSCAIGYILKLNSDRNGYLFIIVIHAKLSVKLLLL